MFRAKNEIGFQPRCKPLAPLPPPLPSLLPTPLLSMPAVAGMGVWTHPLAFDEGSWWFGFLCTLHFRRRIERECTSLPIPALAVALVVPAAGVRDAGLSNSSDACMDEEDEGRSGSRAGRGRSEDGRGSGETPLSE